VATALAVAALTTQFIPLLLEGASALSTPVASGQPSA
jgi:hypothetical protein